MPTEFCSLLLCEKSEIRVAWSQFFKVVVILWTERVCVCVSVYVCVWVCKWVRQLQHDNHDSSSSSESCLSESCHLMVILCNCKSSSQLMAAIPERSSNVMRQHVVKGHHLLQSLGKIKYLYLLYLVKISEAECPCGIMGANSKVFPRSHGNSVECQS